MLSDEQFIDGVWNKYNNYCLSTSKDDFFTKDYNIKNKIILILKTIINFIIVSISTLGVVYAGVITYNYIQKTGKINYTDDINNWFFIDNQELYYQKINTYDDYLLYKENWNDIIELDENDFKDNFLVIILATWRMPDITVDNIRVDEQNLYLTVDNNISNESIKKENYMVSVKIPRDMYRNNIILDIKSAFTKEECDNLKNNGLTYSIEDAKKDNCIIVKDNTLDEASKHLLSAFLNNNLNQNFVRIYNYTSENDSTIITDIKSVNGEYYINIDYRRSKLESNNDIIFAGKYISIEKDEILDAYIRIYAKGLSNIEIPLIIYYKN